MFEDFISLPDPLQSAQSKAMQMPMGNLSPCQGICDSGPFCIPHPDAAKDRRPDVAAAPSSPAAARRFVFDQFLLPLQILVSSSLLRQRHQVKSKRLLVLPKNTKSLCRKPFIGKTSGTWHEHRDHRTSWARSGGCQRPAGCGRTGRGPASAGSWSARRRTSGSRR